MKGNNGLMIVLWMAAVAGLLLTILPPILVFTGSIDFSLHMTLMTIGMVLWFGARIWIQGQEDS